MCALNTAAETLAEIIKEPRSLCGLVVDEDIVDQGPEGGGPSTTNRYNIEVDPGRR